ncbi:MAG TPA: LLM class flavin-dependent oxidoreductase [Ktedonobacterales bacterium]|jgi:alkanesulfonate monooxygenase SsuD/methylene tetrahydromethanopterin reductase-like flavin-dependent oxidoreductase (luciferase family)
MRVGIGLPNAVPGSGGALLLEWVRQAEAGPFTSLGTLDRLRYDSYEPLAALAAAAAITTRLRLATTIVIAPLRNTALLAQTAATVDALSGGRLVLGLAVGAREDDYTTAGVPYHSRGQRLAEQLSALRDHWEGGVIGPRAGRRGGPELLLGGLSDQTFARVARYADGYVHNGGPPRAFARAAEKLRAAWSDAGRPGRPLLWGQGYFALGTGTAEAGAAYLREYYAFTGPFAEKIAAGLLTTPQAVAQYVRGYAEAGCDELMLLPTIPDLAQVAALAEVLASLG